MDHIYIVATSAILWSIQLTNPIMKKFQFIYTDVAVLEKLYKEFPTYRLRRKDIYEKYSGIYY